MAKWFSNKKNPKYNKYITTYTVQHWLCFKVVRLRLTLIKNYFKNIKPWTSALGLMENY